MARYSWDPTAATPAGPPTPASRRMPGPGYWTLVAALTVMTVLAAFTFISIACALLAVGLAALSPLWRRPGIFWPLVGAATGALAVLTLATAGGCTTTVTSVAPPGSVGSVGLVGPGSTGNPGPPPTTVCTHALGVAGTPAVLALGVGAALLGGAAGVAISHAGWQRPLRR